MFSNADGRTVVISVRSRLAPCWLQIVFVARPHTILTGGRVVRGIVEGDSVPEVFLPQLMRLWEQGRFPVERFMTFYDFEQIEQAARGAEERKTIKPVLRMS